LQLAALFGRLLRLWTRQRGAGFIFRKEERMTVEVPRSVAMTSQNSQTEWMASAREPYVDAAAVAEYLKLDRRLVLALTRRGIIPAHPVDPYARKKIWRYKLSEVDTAISQGTGKPSTGIKEVAQTSTPRNNLAGSPRSRKEMIPDG
jgi:hypothetical protein